MVTVIDLYHLRNEIKNDFIKVINTIERDSKEIDAENKLLARTTTDTNSVDYLRRVEREEKLENESLNRVEDEFIEIVNEIEDVITPSKYSWCRAVIDGIIYAFTTLFRCSFGFIRLLFKKSITFTYRLVISLIISLLVLGLLLGGITLLIDSAGETIVRNITLGYNNLSNFVANSKVGFNQPIEGSITMRCFRDGIEVPCGT